jgi:hypothetical protein
MARTAANSFLSGDHALHGSHLSWVSETSLAVSRGLEKGGGG